MLAHDVPVLDGWVTLDAIGLAQLLLLRAVDVGNDGGGRVGELSRKSVPDGER